MDKRVNFALALAVIILVAAGGLYGYFKIADEGQFIDSSSYRKTSLEMNIPKGESAEVARADGNFEIDIASKKLKSVDSRLLDLSLFAGLPKETENVLNSIAVLAPDKSRAIVISAVLDESEESSEFDGSVTVSSAGEFLCNVVEKNCQATDILESAYAAAGGKEKWFSDQSIKWYGMSMGKDVLFGCAAGEDGDVSPVYVYDHGTKELKQSSGFDPKTVAKKATIPSGAFSPSFNKVAMVYSFSDKWYLHLYDINNLAAPLKKIDITAAKDAADEANIVTSVAWSPDEKNLALATENQIFSLNPESEKIVSVYVDMVDEDVSEDALDQGMDSSSIKFSSGGKYVMFIDYDAEKVPAADGEPDAVLNAIDLAGNNKVIELLREKNLSLDVQ